MRICRFNESRLGVVEDDEVIDVTDVLADIPPVRWPVPRGDLFIAHLAKLRPQMARIAEHGQRRRLSDVRLTSPVANPGKIIGAPVNYLRHRDEAKQDAGISGGSAVLTIQEYGLFLKATSSLVGPSEGILCERKDRRIDHELELACVIGEGGRNISEGDALDHVAGYVIALDMTLRGQEDRSYRKSLDSFSVLGPWLVTADEFGDPSAVDLELKVNGVTRQRANTRDLIFNVPKIISYASHAYRLEAGDVFMTGTPEGVGPVQPGDVLDCWVERVGSMTVHVKAA